MNINKTIKITTPKQFEKLIGILEEKPNLAKSYHSGLQKVNIVDEWNQIAIELNSLGPPMREGTGWMKVWADYKCKIKRKLVQNKSECRATGGGTFKQHTLSSLEEAAANLLQLDSIINPGGKTFGVRNRGVSKEPEVHEAAPSDNESSKENNEPISAPHLTRKRKNKRSEKDELLAAQLKVQTELYTDVKQSLKDIERWNRKIFKIKEEQLKLYKIDLKKKDDYRKALLKLRMEEIELKKRKVELEEFKNMS